MKTHVFNHKRYELRSHTTIPKEHHPAEGLCDYENKTLYIPVSAKELTDLDTIIHESLHASIPQLCEYTITRSATEISKLLWKLGWRKNEEQGH
jgi:hypothetical protein